MKKWAVLGVVAAVIVGVLLIGKYQDQKYPIPPDGSTLLEEATHWLSRGGNAWVKGKITLYDSVDLGEHR